MLSREKRLPMKNLQFHDQANFRYVDYSGIAVERNMDCIPRTNSNINNKLINCQYFLNQKMNFFLSYHL